MEGVDETGLMHNIALMTEYDGTGFCGWQSQKNGNSIQDTLIRAICQITGETVKLHGCSRTDAGVHATGHVSNFFSKTKIPIDKLPIALNSCLPPEISVKKAAYVSEDFHARFCARGKQYRYSIWNEPTRPALFHNRAYHAPKPVCIEKMREAAAIMLGTRDFSAFMASGSEVKSTIRTLYSIDIQVDLPLIHLIYRGNGFLYNMVRILSGTLYYIGIGKIDVNDVEKIIEGRDRTRAGKTLSACGLVLEKVFYDEDPFHDSN